MAHQLSEEDFMRMLRNIGGVPSSTGFSAPSIFKSAPAISGGPAPKKAPIVEQTPELEPLTPDRPRRKNVGAIDPISAGISAGTELLGGATNLVVQRKSRKRAAAAEKRRKTRENLGNVRDGLFDALFELLSTGPQGRARLANLSSASTNLGLPGF